MVQGISRNPDCLSRAALRRKNSLQNRASEGCFRKSAAERAKVTLFVRRTPGKLDLGADGA